METTYDSCEVRAIHAHSPEKAIQKFITETDDNKRYTGVIVEDTATLERESSNFDYQVYLVVGILDAELIPADSARSMTSP